MTDKPMSPSDEREEPYYIDNHCGCGEELVLYQDLTYKQMRDAEALADPDVVDRSDEIWYDEWVCPNCLDGVHMDWPEVECSNCGSVHGATLVWEESCVSCSETSEVGLEDL